MLLNASLVEIMADKLSVCRKLMLNMRHWQMIAGANNIDPYLVLRDLLTNVIAMVRMRKTSASIDRTITLTVK